MKLRIGTLDFLVSEAVLDGFLEKDGSLLWSLEVRTEEGGCCQPRIYVNERIRIPIKTLRGLPGMSVRPVGEVLLIAFEHEGIDELRLTFGDWSGLELSTRLTGRCSPGLEFPNDVDVDLEAFVALSFRGIKSRVYNPEEARELLAQTMNPEQFATTRIAGAPGFVLV